MKYIFGFNYQAENGVTYGNSGINVMTYMEAILARDFVQNYNVMFAFVLVSAVIAGIFYFKSKRVTNKDKLE